MKVRDVKKLGITGGELIKQARALIGEIKRQKISSARIQEMIRAVIHDPETYHDHRPIHLPPVPFQRNLPSQYPANAELMYWQP